MAQRTFLLDQLSPSLLKMQRRSTRPTLKRSLKNLRRRSQSLKHLRAPRHHQSKSKQRSQRRKSPSLRPRRRSHQSLLLKAAAVDLNPGMLSSPVLSQREWLSTVVFPSARSRELALTDASSRPTLRTTSHPLVLHHQQARDQAHLLHRLNCHLAHHQPRT